MEAKELKKLIEDQLHYEYLQLPKSLSKKLDISNKSDYKGVIGRYQLIKSFIKEYPINTVTDIGGNCGYFSLSLLDEGLIEKAVVYDINSEILKIGEKIAEFMNLSSKCKFVKKNVNLEQLKKLDTTDAVIHQNVLHHAGDYFDKDMVEKSGWENYAHSFLKQLRQKYNYGIIGMGFKWNKPKYWDIEKSNRKSVFDNLLKKAGWEIISDVNVSNLLDCKGNISYKEMNSQNNEINKSNIASFCDLITFNVIKYISIQLGSRTEVLKKTVPGVFKRANEIAKMYHLYLLK